MGDFDKLLEPGRIGSLTLKNRMITTAMVTLYADEKGLPTERYIRYHEEKARGGWGLVITEDYAITPTGRTFDRLPGLWSDEQVPAHAEFVRRVHAAGGTICCQLFHPGRQTSCAVAGERPIAPSAVRDAAMPDVPREMTQTDIDSVVKAFGEAARRVKECGFDMVELHGAHGYLLGQFFSSHTNKRTDRYGGSLGNRARFALEVLAAVRGAVGSDYPISYRLNVNDCVEHGVTPQEARVLARLLEKGGVDFLNCSQGIYESTHMIIPPAAIGHAHFSDDAAVIHDAVSIPTSTVGRINDPYMAESLLGSKADFISMGRASLADPFFPSKVAQGTPERIITCIGCCRGCLGEENRGRPLCCIVNPRTGFEGRYVVEPAEVPGTVLVVGGGVAGCEAAIVAAERGHRVSVWEASSCLGGQWRVASVPPGKEDFSSFVAWQGNRMRELGIRVEYGKRADAASVAASRPDAVILATGSTTAYPPIPGLRDSGVVVDARDVLAGACSVQGSIAVLGGGLVGAETAELLAEQGNSVTVFEMLPEVAADCEPNPKVFLLEALRRGQVKLRPSCRILEIQGGKVVFQGKGNEAESEQFDHIVVALGALPRKSLADDLAAAGFKGPIVPAGDETGVKDGLLNIREGYEAGLRVLA